MVLVNGDFRPGLPQEIFLGEVSLGAGGPTRMSCLALFGEGDTMNHKKKEKNHRIIRFKLRIIYSFFYFSCGYCFVISA